MQIKILQNKLREFAKEREWEQFHSPKNLAMALSVEVSELLEVFQWMTEEESRSLTDDLRESVAEEVADVQIYLARIADVLEIDIERAVDAKLQANNEKYPADRVRGSSKKYNSYDTD